MSDQHNVAVEPQAPAKRMAWRNKGITAYRRSIEGKTEVISRIDEPRQSVVSLKHEGGTDVVTFGIYGGVLEVERS